MKFDAVENENYAATVVSVRAVNVLDGCDNVVGVPIFGFQAIVGKDVAVGDLGIIFPAESQLSEAYCEKNNLFRHKELNSDITVGGYLEDNRRVKAMKFRGHRSDCLFMPLESLEFTGIKADQFEEGDTFDQLRGVEICKKYVRAGVCVQRVGVEKNKKVFERIDDRGMPKHHDSDNYWKNSGHISGDREVIVSQKLHGTSIRVGNVQVKKKLGWFASLLSGIGVDVNDVSYDMVYGSRNVIKDVGNEELKFYGTDVWISEGKKLAGIIPKDYIVYGEIVGYVNETPVQSGYTYGYSPGSCGLFVYRVAHINPDGIVCDLTWDQMVEWCADLGLRTVPFLWRGKHGDFVVDDWTDKRFADAGYKGALPLSGAGSVDEGVCVRVDGLSTYCLKAKSPIFLGWESEMLDKEVVDIEEDA